jgi:hypothetical protein
MPLQCVASSVYPTMSILLPWWRRDALPTRGDHNSPLRYPMHSTARCRSRRACRAGCVAYRRRSLTGGVSAELAGPTTCQFQVSDKPRLRASAARPVVLRASDCAELRVSLPTSPTAAPTPLRVPALPAVPLSLLMAVPLASWKSLPG